ncbi:MAG: hypothetical protein ACLU6W_07045 [Lachnospiraceae bacterium]
MWYTPWCTGKMDADEGLLDDTLHVKGVMAGGTFLPVGIESEI